MSLRKVIDEILAFRSPRYLTTSLFLEVDGRKYPQDEYVTVFKDLVKRGHHAATRDVADRESLLSVQQDLERIERYLRHGFERAGTRGLAIFSCSAEGYFRTLPLPVPFRDRLVVEPCPYARPLQVLADAERRIAIVLVDQREARFFLCELSQVRAVDEVLHDVPPMVRTSGSRRDDSRRLERHVEVHRHAHYAAVAERLLALFRREGCDLLVTGGPKEDALAFEAHLHPVLQDRLAGRITADLLATRRVLQEKVVEIEREVEARETEKRMGKLFEQARRGALGVLGLPATLEALNRGQVHSLFIREGFEVPGRVCHECRVLCVEEQVCPLCEKPTAAAEDIVDEALEEALLRRCPVYTAPAGHSEFARAGSIGALLRYRE